MLRYLAIAALLLWGNAAYAVEHPELVEMISLLKQHEKKLKGAYSEGGKWIRATFESEGVFYEVELERNWFISARPPYGTYRIRGATLFIRRDRVGPGTSDSETFVDHDFKGKIDYASSLHQPPFNREAPREYTYISRRGNCPIIRPWCKAVGTEWQSVAQTRYDKVVREIIAVLRRIG